MVVGIFEISADLEQAVGEARFDEIFDDDPFEDAVVASVGKRCLRDGGYDLFKWWPDEEI